MTKGWYRRLSRIGNAVPVRIGESSFLLTVAHVLDQARSRTGDLTELFAQTIGESGEVVDLRDSYVLSTDRSEFPSRFDDPLDISVITLSNPAAEKLSKTSVFLRLSDFVSDAFSSEPGYYFIQGLPDTGPRFSLRRLAWFDKTLAFGSDLYSNEENRAKHYHPACHLELNYDGHGYKVDSWSSYYRIRSLAGVSGCGLWRFHSHAENPLGWGVDRVRLAGIVQSVDPETKTLRASRICFFLHFIASQSPGLAKQLEHHVADVDEIVRIWENWPTNDQ
jgi:hypothetical protein